MFTFFFFKLSTLVSVWCKWTSNCLLLIIFVSLLQFLFLSLTGEVYLQLNFTYNKPFVKERGEQKNQCFEISFKVHCHTFVLIVRQWNTLIFELGFKIEMKFWREDCLWIISKFFYFYEIDCNAYYYSFKQFDCSLIFEITF